MNLNIWGDLQICISVTLIDCVNIWKTSKAANLAFQWIFVLNSVKHKFFPLGIVKATLSKKLLGHFTVTKTFLSQTSTFFNEKARFKPLDVLVQFQITVNLVVIFAERYNGPFKSSKIKQINLRIYSNIKTLLLLLLLLLFLLLLLLSLYLM